jgi:hypothetical protein
MPIDAASAPTAVMFDMIAPLSGEIFATCASGASQACQGIWANRRRDVRAGICDTTTAICCLTAAVIIGGYLSLHLETKGFVRLMFSASWDGELGITALGKLDAGDAL